VAPGQVSAADRDFSRAGPEVGDPGDLAAGIKVEEAQPG
jgi:hypothetical protein